jgi:thiamine pyrophosphate-dependent acetolactate synthase large subunit-like protein
VTVVQVEIDPTRAGVRLPTDVPLIGDVGATLEALLPLLHRRSDRGHLEKYQQEMREWSEKMVALREPARNPIAPQYLAGLLDELATDDAIMTCDSGTVATWAARHWTIRGGREFYLPGNLATMACGLPDYAAWARGCGGYGVHVDKLAALPDVLREAFAHDGPALVDVAVDPNEPPMPGKVEYDQAKQFATSFRAAIATTLFKDRIQQLRAD